MTPQTSAAVEALYASGQVQRPQSNKDASLCFEEGMWWWRWGGDGPDAAGMSAIRPDSVIFESLVHACWAKGWMVVPVTDRYIVAKARENGDPIVSDPDPIDAMIAALNGGG